MKIATQIVFRRITSADFFNIYKAPGTEAKGGGQSYIDVDTSGVSLANWRNFFTSIRPSLNEKGYPLWSANIHSLGMDQEQLVEIGQRRAASVNIRSQKLNTRRSNRVYAWHPDHGFPRPLRPLRSKSEIPRSLIEGLVIFILRDAEGLYWAGWFQDPTPTFQTKDPRLMPMLTRSDGYIDLENGISFDETKIGWPFESIPLKESPVRTSVNRDSNKSGLKQPRRSRTITQKSEEELLKDLFDEDDGPDDGTKIEKKSQLVRVRNTAAVKALKELYGGKCQISGARYIFKKSDGSAYVEAHHLVPLGSGGADEPHNLIVISAHIHRMLHYAKIEGIDLSKIKDNKLEIRINGEKHTITWHPKHAKKIEDTMKKIKPTG